MQITQINQPEMERERFVDERGISSLAGMVFKTCCSIAAFVAVLAGTPYSSLADDIPLVYAVENTGTNCAAPPLPPLGQLRLVQPLPDPFMWADWSGRSTNFADWECRRAEIKAQIENYEIGPKPAVDPGNVTAGYTNGILTVYVTVNGKTLTLTSQVLLPSGSGPFPAVIGMNSPNGSIPSSLFTSRNIARITFNHNQVTVYGNQQNTDPYYQLYGPALNSNNTGQYSAWAWGVSRLIDGLQLVTNVLPIDVKHLCVTGCSYAGKMALFSGAFDERIALTIAQESGGGGATSWRYSHTEPPGSVECIENTDHNWFMESMFQFGGNNVSYLPEDHHELMAMCAPRALFVTSNPGWIWLSNPSCYVCSRACQQIYQTLGIPDRFGFSHIGGHTHCVFPDSQGPEVGAFLDKFLLGITIANTDVQDYPAEYASINYARWFGWWGTTNPIFPATSISLSIPAAAMEGDGTLVGQGSLTLSPIPTNDFTVNLTSSDTSEVTVPASILIPAGQSNAVFDLTIIDDGISDGDQVATIIASAPDCTNAYARITVYDNSPPDHFAWNAVPSPQLIGEPFGITITAQSIDNSTLNYRLPVTLSALIVGNATGTNAILNSPDPEQLMNDGSEYVLGYSFTPGTNLKVTHVRHYFGDNVSIWTDNGQLLVSQNVVSDPGNWVDTPLPTPLVLLAGGTYRIVAHENGVEFYWSSDLPTTFQDGTINQSFWDYGDVFPTQGDD
ncbi:MAG TPA: hypothetical protein VFD66_00680, partial [Verrucomicrobiae bacterium]|nr:hypothetical protein [Verrucomicrobiae bacterium]